MEWEEKFKEAWSNTVVKAGGGPRIPDGKNRVKVVDAAYDQILRAAKWVLEFPDAGGKRLTKTNFMFDKAGVPQFVWTKQDLEVLGAPPETMESVDTLEEALQSTIGVYAQVTLVTPQGGKYSNIYFNHRLGEADTMEESPVPSDW